ncbi:hypothetical protein C6P46_004193 [Rhodotorula mucilaginosa]|uniref:Uncharacterized protein n=1 Tax=Rhodotorula mucilaginosa TaxID=5537 RepID=A0A9P7B663_RHOMI|nr:hypothetical protein C6P46_004193 [Rhodotorula mucilaginosa]
MSRLAFTTLFALAFLQLVAAIPVADAAALSNARLSLDARAGIPDRAGHDRRAATLSSASNAGSTTSSSSSTQSLLDMVAAVITKLSQAKAAKTAGLSTARKSYSAMVAFGASYTDNAHARSNADRGSLRNFAPFSTWNGRYTNGPVAVEYMVQSDLSPALPQGSGGVKLVDYAFGGSVVQNGLDGTGTAYPAAENQARPPRSDSSSRKERSKRTDECLYSQVANYLADLKGGSINVGSGRVLHYFNTGINPVMAIFNNMLRAGSSAQAVSYAQTAVANNANALIKAIRSINTDSTVQSKTNGHDFLIVGIPQMDLTPVAHNAIPSSYNQRQINAALSQLQALTNQYNTALSSFAQSFKSEVAGGNVYFFDLASLWTSLTNSGPEYGITQGTKTCLSGTKMCSNPNQYLYLDTLHPVTSVHKLWAQKMNALVAGNS